MKLMRRRAVLAWGLLLLVLLAVFLYRSQDDIGRSFRTARDADPGWMLVVVLLAIASQVGFSHVLWLIARRLHPGLRWRAAADAHLQRFGVGALAPVPGPGVVALTRSFRARGVSTENCLLAVALEAFVGHASLVIYLAPLLAVLAFAGRVSVALLAGSAVLVVISAGIALLIGLALRPGALPGAIERRIPARGLAYLDVARAHRVSARDLIRPLVVALAINVTGAATIYAALAAVGAEPTVAMAAAAYGAATLFLLVAPFFSGIGVVEFGAVVTLRQFDVPADEALSATILYRVAALWLPLAVALLAPAINRFVRVLRGRAGR